MTIQQLTRILEQHGISHEVVNGKVLAEDSYTLNGESYSDIIDLTDISPEQLYDWLGY